LKYQNRRPVDNLGLGCPNLPNSPIRSPVASFVADMKNVLMTGQFADAKIVMIENLQVNVIKAEAGSTVNAHSGPMPVGKSGKTRG
jgi:hypothetical protein